MTGGVGGCGMTGGGGGLTSGVVTDEEGVTRGRLTEVGLTTGSGSTRMDVRPSATDGAGEGTVGVVVGTTGGRPTDRLLDAASSAVAIRIVAHR